MSMRTPRSNSSSSRRRHSNGQASSPSAHGWARGNLVELQELERSNEWRDKKEIGEGNCKVYRIRWHGNLVAFKKFHWRLPVDRALREVNALREISSTNVIGYRGLVVENDNVRGVFLELCHLNLCTHIQTLHEAQADADRLPFAQEMEQIAILQGVASGLAAIHRHDFVHRDIKPANILLQRNGSELVAKIADFETSRDERGRGTTTATSTTTEAYMAPEVLYDNQWSPSSDVWSFGLVAGELFSNRKPLASLLPENQSVRRYLVDWLRDGSDETGAPAYVYTPANAAAGGMAVPHALRTLVVERCLHREVSERPSSDQLRQALDNAMGRMQQRLPRGPLYRVIYAKQPAFHQGIFARNPHDTAVSLKDHVKNGSKRGSTPSRYVSTTTSFEWAVFYAAKQYTLSGYVDNPFIVEISSARLRQHLASRHVKCLCVNDCEDAERNGVSSTMAQHFAVSAQEVCLESLDANNPAIPRDTIVQVYQLPLRRDRKRPDKYACRPGTRNNRQLHPLQIKASERQDYVHCGQYVCRKFESFAAWMQQFRSAFPDVHVLEDCMKLGLEHGCRLIQERALEVQEAFKPDSTPTVRELVAKVKERELADDQLKDRLARSGCPVSGRFKRGEAEITLARVLWREACFWRERWPRHGGYSSRWELEESREERDLRAGMERQAQEARQFKQELRALRASSAEQSKRSEDEVLQLQQKLGAAMKTVEGLRSREQQARQFEQELRALRASSAEQSKRSEDEILRLQQELREALKKAEEWRNREPESRGAAAAQLQAQAATTSSTSESISNLNAGQARATPSAKLQGPVAAMPSTVTRSTFSSAGDQKNERKRRAPSSRRDVLSMGSRESSMPSTKQCRKDHSGTISPHARKTMSQASAGRSKVWCSTTKGASVLFLNF